MDRATAIRKSLTAFVCGILSLLPVLGFVPALWAFLEWNQVRVRFSNEWNPANRYLQSGIVMALLGLLFSVLITFAALIAMVQR